MKLQQQHLLSIRERTKRIITPILTEVENVSRVGVVTHEYAEKKRKEVRRVVKRMAFDVRAVEEAIKLISDIERRFSN